MKLNTITWFELYRMAVNRRGWALEARGKRFGIGIAKDLYAIEYQRRDRQVRKFEGKLRVLFGQTYYKNRCGRCGYMRNTEACCKNKKPPRS